jgi:hypothetical protein
MNMDSFSNTEKWCDIKIWKNIENWWYIENRQKVVICWNPKYWLYPVTGWNTGIRWHTAN